MWRCATRRGLCYVPWRVGGSCKWFSYSLYFTLTFQWTSVHPSPSSKLCTIATPTIVTIATNPPRHWNFLYTNLDTIWFQNFEKENTYPVIIVDRTSSEAILFHWAWEECRFNLLSRRAIPLMVSIFRVRVKCSISTFESAIKHRIVIQYLIHSLMSKKAN